MSFFLSPLGNEIEDPFFGEEDTPWTITELLPVDERNGMLSMEVDFSDFSDVGPDLFMFGSAFFDRSPMRSIQQMNSMMNSVFSNAFGGMLQSPLGLPQITSSSPGILSPFGFPSFERMFEGFTELYKTGCETFKRKLDVDGERLVSRLKVQFAFQDNPTDSDGQYNVFQAEEKGTSVIKDMMPEGNSHSFSSSTVMTLTNGPDGHPQVYQASSSTRTAPGGVRETKKAVCDSRSGIKKLAIGHHIGDRGHVMEKQQNLISGEQEEHQDFINISEDEAEEFNKEFEEKAKRGMAGTRNRIEDAPRTQLNRYEGHANMGRHNRRLALPPSTSGSKSAALHKERPRKREHEPEANRSHKTLKAAQNDGKNIDNVNTQQ